MVQVAVSSHKRKQPILHDSGKELTNARSESNFSLSLSLSFFCKCIRCGVAKAREPYLYRRHCRKHCLSLSSACVHHHVHEERKEKQNVILQTSVCDTSIKLV